MNSGSKEGDDAKMETLGAFSKAFGAIISGTATNRTDIEVLKELLEKKGARLYRGTGLTKEELLKYAALVGIKNRDDLMALTGFISTTMKRPIAESFAWSKPKTGHESTLFEIMWKKNTDYYVMDMSAFPDEREVLVYDGTKFFVESVTLIEDSKGKAMNHIILKNYGYKD